jgi:D-alanine-D-alanine ligase
VDSYQVAVFFGGRSSEHNISIVSAQGIVSALMQAGHRVIPVGVARDGSWFYVDPADLVALDGPLPELPDGTHAMQVVWDASGVTLSHASGDSWRPDMAFPILHGPWGEDGAFQGLLESMGLPYVGSGVLASACAMDKPTTKAMLAHAGLPVGDWFTQPPDVWPGPMFVKPARAGSSIGISRVDDPAQLPEAIATARRHDDRLIFETAIEGAREIECGVIQARDRTLRASRCAEITVPGGFYDFDAKYRTDAATLVVPAELPEGVEQHIQDLAKKVFSALGCEGFARVDFFLKEDGTVLVNELNTLPGFTPISMFPRMWQASGMTYSELLNELLLSAHR